MEPENFHSAAEEVELALFAFDHPDGNAEELKLSVNGAVNWLWPDIQHDSMPNNNKSFFILKIWGLIKNQKLGIGMDV